MARWHDWFVAVFDARSLRERLLIGLTICVVTWAFWEISIGGAVTDSKAEVITDIDRLARDLEQQNFERDRLLELDRTPEREALRRQQERLNGLLVAQAEELDALLARFVPPEDVPALLEDVLKNHEGLKLVRLTSQPAEPVTITVEMEEGSDPDEASEVPQVEIYRHPVLLEFEGGYLDVLAYLESLEQVGWQFAWRRLEYAVAEYPDAQVLIELETLSREKEWLGV